ncbi:hypothetical protein MesoLj131c_63200 [Mesorhizobium sp. 131-3-5]|uniref:hypothetical protein n=1 Tax=Mesorhizobium sp. 131-3-5 TaxID=2744520 RepID=UPI0019357CBA|nr:hypothetical protein [Mesorhizobium sp. 131-3-5]BCH12062.1 hypothetical protein MesoLj131c_63200 [Mesorhizobium sp. 131-3-5]
MNSLVSALRFFFTHTIDRPDLARMQVRLAHPRKLPVAHTRRGGPAPQRHHLPQTPGRAVGRFGARLRVAEVSTLKVADVDSERMLLRVERGKGGRYRNSMLSQDLLLLLRKFVTKLMAARRRMRLSDTLAGDTMGQARHHRG